MRAPHPSRRAREAANLTLERAAKLLRLSPGYLARLEASGEWSFFRASEALRIYGERGAVACLEDFLPMRRDR